VSARSAHAVERRAEEESEQLDFDYASLDFDDLLGKKTPAESSAGKPQAEALDDETETLDFDNIIQFEPSAFKPQASASASPKDQSIDDFLAELETATKAARNSLEPEDDEDRLVGNEIEFDLSAFEKPGLSEQTRTLAAEKKKPDEDEDIYSGLTDMDEQETKLDLAKAYVDMGDDATAREILQTVAMKGNEQQREEAKTWLEKISA
jgi:pilus assembly protein FimV